MKQIILLLCAISINIQTFASKNDTTIFSTPFEKQLFLRDINNPSAPAINWFIALQYTNQCPGYIAKYQKFSNELKNEVQSFPTKKKLKTIYKKVHEYFFSKYEVDSYFSDIFESGTYNCVSASALYSMILSDLKIPFTIKEKTDHVYIIADPAQSDFMIETTMPSGGLIQYDIKTMSNYVQYLHDNKIISNEEFKNESIESLFNKHFITDKSITLKELAGLQYYNKAYFLNKKLNYTEALKNIEKAELLYPCDLIRYFKSNLLLTILSEENLKKAFDGKTLAKYLCSNSENKNAKSIALDYFKVITDELVINHPNISNYDQIYNDLKEYADTISIDEFANTYFLFKGYYSYTKYDFKGALKYLQEAYKINPENIRTRQMVSEIVIKSFTDNNDVHNGLDSITRMVTLFPFLQTDINVKKYLIYLYSDIIADAYRANNRKGAEKYLDNLETLLKEPMELGRLEEPVTQVYNQMATYFFSSGNRDASLKGLERGMKFLPNSYILTQRHKSLSNYKPGSVKPTTNKTNTLTAEKQKCIAKYKEGLAYAKLNRDSINAGAAKYLTGKWRLQIPKEAKTKNYSSETENVNITFLENKKALMEAEISEDENFKTQGTWKYDPNSCILSIGVPEIPEQITMLILDISETQIRCIGFAESDFSDSEEATMTKVAN